MERSILTALVILVLGVGLSINTEAQVSQYHLIQAGDTLRKIATIYDTTVLELLDLNPGITPDNLQIGAKLNLPLEPLFSYHIIQPRDNVHSLAAQYEVPLAALLEANGITDNKVNVGEMIRIPMHLYQKEYGSATHVVEIGDTLYKLARRYGVTLTQLAERNELDDLNTIIAGQVLVIK